MKIIFRSLFSLGLVQAINLFIPLLITPYLIGILGLATYGVIATAQSLAVFFNLVVDFGFNLTAVRRIAKAKGDKKEIQSIVNRVFFLKLILLAISAVIYFPLTFYAFKFQENYLLYVCSFTLIVGQAFLPLWFYQGTERTDKLIAPIILSKVIVIILIFLLVKKIEDSFLVNFILGFGNILAGTYLFVSIKREYMISRTQVNAASLKTEFKEGFALFVSNIGVLTYANSSLLILSFFLNPFALGIYSIADKVIQALRSLLGLLHQATYPRICTIVKESMNQLSTFIKNVYGVIWVIVFLGCAMLFFLSSFVVSYFIKDISQVQIASQTLKQLSFLLLIVSLNMPFYQCLLAFEKDWLAVKILFLGAVLSVVINIILVPAFKIEGAVISLYIVEIVVTSALIYYALQIKKQYGQQRVSQ